MLRYIVNCCLNFLRVHSDDPQSSHYDDDDQWLVKYYVRKVVDLATFVVFASFQETTVGQWVVGRVTDRLDSYQVGQISRIFSVTCGIRRVDL